MKSNYLTIIQLSVILIPLDHSKPGILKNRLEGTTQLYQNLVARFQGPMAMMIAALMFRRTTGLFIVSLTHGGTLIAWEKAPAWRHRLHAVIIAAWQIWLPASPDVVQVHTIDRQTYFLPGTHLLQNTPTPDTGLPSLVVPIPGHLLMTPPQPTNSDVVFTQPPNDRVPLLLILPNQSPTSTGPMIPVAHTVPYHGQIPLIFPLKRFMRQRQLRQKTS